MVDALPGDRNPSDNDGLPLEIEVYIEPDGSVTFADLAADVLPLARALNPDQVSPDDQEESSLGSEDVRHE
jgi:hypothetical protein